MKKARMLWFLFTVALLVTASFVGVQKAHAQYFDQANATWSGNAWGARGQIITNGGLDGRDAVDAVPGIQLSNGNGVDTYVEFFMNGGVSGAACGNNHFGFEFYGQTKEYCSSKYVGETGTNGSSIDDTFLLTISHYSSNGGGWNIWVQDKTTSPNYYFCNGGSAPTCTASGGSSYFGEIQGYTYVLYDRNPASEDYVVNMTSNQWQNSSGAWSNHGGGAYVTNGVSGVSLDKGYDTSPYDQCFSDVNQNNC